MSVSKAKRQDEASQKARPGAQPGKVREGQDGGGQAAGGIAAAPGFGFHLLTSQLHSRSLFELAMMYGAEPIDEPGLFSLVDTEEKQLQAIEDLYRIMKAQPKYKNLKEKKWKADTSPIEVLHWLLRKLGPLAGGETWTIDSYPDGRKTRYRFVTYRHYSGYDVKGKEQLVDLEFLPHLKKRDEPLHDLIVDVVALVSRCNKVPLWDEDGDFSAALSDIREETFLASVMYKGKYETYINGPAAQYLKLIKQRRRKVTVQQLKQQVNNYVASSERKRIVLWWVRCGIEVAECRQSITQNTYVPNYRTGDPVTPYRLYKFVWSPFNSDPLTKRADIRLRQAEDDGYFVPLQFSITLPGQEVKPIVPDRFPVYLDRFMNYGSRLFCSSYRDYFYKRIEQERKENQEATTLLENIELMDHITINV